MTDRGGSYHVQSSLDHGEDPTTALFSERVVRGDLPELHPGAWPTSERTLDAVGAPVLRARADGSGSGG